MPKRLRVAGHSVPAAPPVLTATDLVVRHGVPITPTAVIQAMVTARGVAIQAGVAMTTRCHPDAQAREAIRVTAAVAWTGVLVQTGRLVDRSRAAHLSSEVVVISSVLGEIHQSLEIAGVARNAIS